MSNKNKSRTGVVFSTDPEFEYTSLKEDETPTPLPSGQVLRVRVEKKFRGGKTVTIVDGFTGRTADREALGKVLKQKCGTGGSVKDGLILIQGGNKDQVIKILRDLGYPAK